MQKSKPTVQSTLSFLIRDNKVLLAQKKRGFGVGKWNGVGGKKNNNETIEQAAKRETEEEIEIVVEKITHIGTFEFYYLHKPEWDQQVFVYIVDEWSGEPQETEEMAPRWFEFSQIPFAEMWPDDKHWLPHVLDNKKISGEFTFTSDGGIQEYKLIL
jgi:mutator protein MutT